MVGIAAEIATERKKCKMQYSFKHTLLHASIPWDLRTNQHQWPMLLVRSRPQPDVIYKRQQQKGLLPAATSLWYNPNIQPGGFPWHFTIYSKVDKLLALIIRNNFRPTFAKTIVRGIHPPLRQWCISPLFQISTQFPKKNWDSVENFPNFTFSQNFSDFHPSKFLMTFLNFPPYFTTIPLPNLQKLLFPLLFKISPRFC